MYLYNIKCLVNDLENDGKHEASSIKMKLLQVDAKHAKQEEHMIVARRGDILHAIKAYRATSSRYRHHQRSNRIWYTLLRKT